MQTSLSTWKGATQTHMERRHSLRDQKKDKTAISVNLNKLFCETTYTLEVYLTYMNTFEKKNILRESTLKLNLGFA